MGKKDVLSKTYMDDNRRFADLVNNVIFDGENTISSENLFEKDTKETGIIPKSLEGFLTLDKERDNVKLCKIKSSKDDAVEIVLIGIEDQSRIHYAMPVKNSLYGDLDYARQVEMIRKRRKKEKSFRSGDEFLSGLNKEDRLTPVITIVLYLGDTPWDGARSLHDMLDCSDGRIFRFVPDYRINLLDPHEIEDFSGYQTELRWLLEAIKASSDKKSLRSLFERHRDVYSDLDIETASLIGELFNVKVPQERINSNGGVNMCNAVLEIRNEGRAEGEAIGEVKGQVKLLRQKFHYTPTQTAEELGIDLEQVENILKEADAKENEKAAVQNRQQAQA